jgi:hypothetical protein
MESVMVAPGWAYDFCYYYFAVAVLVALSTVWIMISLIGAPDYVKKIFPVGSVGFMSVVSGTLATILLMMQFWICRSSLKTTEKFAASCGTVGDCTAVMGQPQGGDCTCGGRGYCGGCTMRNNMEPSMLPEYGFQFSDIAEGFRTQPQIRTRRGAPVAGRR